MKSLKQKESGGEIGITEIKNELMKNTCKNITRIREVKKTYKIYILLCPFTNDIRYIGYTNLSVNKRLSSHCNPSKLKKNTHKNNWIKSVMNKKLKPNILCIEENIPSLTEALNREIFFVKRFKDAGCNLTNSTDGGEGHLNHKLSKESIIKILETKKKNGTLKHSKTTIENIKKSLIGRKVKPEIIEKLADIHRKPVLQFDLDGNLLKEWSGIRVASTTHKISHNGILRCLTGGQKSYKGFIWKYKQ